MDARSKASPSPPPRRPAWRERRRRRHRAARAGTTRGEGGEVGPQVEETLQAAGGLVVAAELDVRRRRRPRGRRGCRVRRRAPRCRRRERSAKSVRAPAERAVGHAERPASTGQQLRRRVEGLLGQPVIGRVAGLVAARRYVTPSRLPRRGRRRGYRGRLRCSSAAIERSGNARRGRRRAREAANIAAATGRRVAGRQRKRARPRHGDDRRRPTACVSARGVALVGRGQVRERRRNGGSLRRRRRSGRCWAPVELRRERVAPATARSSMSVTSSTSRRPFGNPALSPPRKPSRSCSAAVGSDGRVQPQHLRPASRSRAG